MTCGDGSPLPSALILEWVLTESGHIFPEVAAPALF